MCGSCIRHAGTSQAINERVDGVGLFDRTRLHAIPLSSRNIDLADECVIDARAAQTRQHGLRIDACTECAGLDVTSDGHRWRCDSGRWWRRGCREHAWLRFFAGFDHSDFDGCGTATDHAEFVCGRVREIDDAITDERAPVVHFETTERPFSR